MFAIGTLAVLSLGCGAGEDGKPEPGTACESEPGALLCPPPAAEGLQLRIQGTVEGGVETTFCQFFEAPEGGFDVARFSHVFTGTSHHLLVYSTTMTPERIAEYPGTFACSAAEQFGMDIGSVFFGAQEPQNDQVLPEGVVMRAASRQILLLEYHVLNAASPTRVDAEARVNLWFPTTPANAVAGQIFFFNPLIYIAPNATSTAHMRCDIPRDLYLFRSGGHMHRRGKRLESWLTGGDLTEPELLFETETWDEPVYRRWDPPKLLKAGQVIDFTCNFQNDADTAVTAGLSAATDEMCLFGSRYFTADGTPLTTDQDWCRTGPGPQGNGTLSCSEVDARMQAEANLAPDQTAFYYGCLDSACPGNTINLWTTLDQCRSDACPACQSQDAAGRSTLSHDSPECVACVAASCAEQNEACATHHCQ